jgi:hypothetical protein
MVQVSRAAQPAAGGEPRCAPGSLPTNDPRARVCTVGHAIALPLPNHLPRRRPSPNRHLCWPSTARASFERQALTRADHEPVVDAAGDHADPGHPSRAAACPTAALHDLTSAGHSGRGNARTPDTGQRTPGRSDARTGHWTPVAWTGTRGHWSLAPDTGRRTLAEDTDRVTKARPAAGPPGPPRRATPLGRPNRVPVDGACGAPQPMEARR